MDVVKEYDALVLGDIRGDDKCAHDEALKALERMIREEERSGKFAEIGYLLKNEYGFVSAHVPNLRELPVGQTAVYSRRDGDNDK